MFGFVFIIYSIIALFRTSNGGGMGNLKGGDRFIQLGEFRIGVVDYNHFSVSSAQKTSIIFRNDGTVHPGPRNDYGLWGRPLLSSPSGVHFTGNGVQIGAWCLGISATNHLSITHNNGADADKTAMIWRNDGTRHGGPRNDYSCWNNAHNNNVNFGIDSRGFEYIQWGNTFRMGKTAANHLSIASDRTCVIYRNDGTVHPGPRDDYAWPPF